MPTRKIIKAKKPSALRRSSASRAQSNALKVPRSFFPDQNILSVLALLLALGGVWLIHRSHAVPGFSFLALSFLLLAALIFDWIPFLSGAAPRLITTRSRGQASVGKSTQGVSWKWRLRN